MNTVLLSSVIRPFRTKGEGDSVGAELFHAQVTRAQEIFSPRQVVRCWAIDYIAANLSTPCVVLHYPSESEFIRELKHGSYDYVGINFVVSTFHKARKMATLVRKHSPRSKIVLGGYGTVLPDELLIPYSDYICREEGIGFMRRLLGECAIQKISHPYAPIPTPSMYSYQRNEKVGHLTAGLGCPNGCDFCCTSHFFKRRYVPFLESGGDIYDAMVETERRAHEAGDHLSCFILIDEDFFLYKQRARDFLHAVRKNKKPFSVMGFGSVRGLSQFSAEEITEMGFETIWTAFEGKQSGFSKLKGKPIPQLYKELRACGVSVLSSMIIGFPYQDRDQVEREFGELMALDPALTQILIYFAFPGTPFHRQVIAEGRYLPEYKAKPNLRRWDGFAMHFTHPHFTPTELESLQRTLYRKDFDLLGPSLVRLMDVWLEGYRNLRSSANELLRDRARIRWQNLVQAFPALVPAMWWGPSTAARARARKLYGELKKEMGKIPLPTRLKCAGAPLMALWTSAIMKLGIFQQPGCLRLEFRTPGAALRKPQSIMRLQGGFQANPLKMVCEDIANKVSVLVNSVRGATGIDEEGFCAKTITNPSEQPHQNLVCINDRAN